MTFRCKTCGEWHDPDDISFGAEAPAQWELLTEAESAASELGSDQCVIRLADGKTDYFVRACLEIPIRGKGRTFSWGVWVSLSEANFDETAEHWEDPERTQLGPYFGWLCTALPEYPDTMFLRTRVHQREVGLRPLVEVEPTEHLLALHQRNGVDPAWLEALIERLLHE